MNDNTTELTDEADLCLRVILSSPSPTFRLVAARQLGDIAKRLQAEVAEPERGETIAADEPSDDRPVIDLAMKYRTRDGREVTGLSSKGVQGSIYPLRGLVDGIIYFWTAHGKINANSIESNSLDLIPTGERA